MARCWHVSTRTEEHDTGPLMACFYSLLAIRQIHTFSNNKIKPDLTKLPSACPVPHMAYRLPGVASPASIVRYQMHSHHTRIHPSLHLTKLMPEPSPSHDPPSHIALISLSTSCTVVVPSGRRFFKIDTESRRGDNIINPYPTDVVVVVVQFLFPTTTWNEIHYKNTTPFAHKHGRVKMRDARFSYSRTSIDTHLRKQK